MLDRGAASLGIDLEAEEWVNMREERYAEDERLQELKARLEELQREEDVGLMGDLEGGRRTD